MKEKIIFNAITNIDEKYINEASVSTLKINTNKWKRWAGLAACITLLLSISVILLHGKRLPLGGSSQSGSGYNENGIFDFYAGPVMPLTLDNEDDEISASRNLSFDFSMISEDSIRVWGSQISDSYTLTNKSDKEKTITGLYPFVSSFQNIYVNIPELLVADEKVKSKLYAGSDYASPIYLKETDNRGNGFEISSFDGYKNLLEDERYKANALMQAALVDQQVIVYKFTDFEAPEEYDAATQAISFNINPEVTRVLQYGFNGSEFGEDGFRRYSYSVPRTNIMSNNDMKVLIVIGEDIKDYELKAYKNGACDKGNELEGVSAKVTRTEENLKDLMRLLVEDYFKRYDKHFLQEYGLEENFVIDNEILNIFEGSFSEFVQKHDLFSLPETDNYSYGFIDDVIFMTDNYQRVFYLEFEVTIPPNSSVEIIAHSHKSPSHNFRSDSSNSGKIQGYDMATQLASNLSFDMLTAHIKQVENIEIVDQNFGFNLDEGTTSVELDLENEHYYFNVKALER